MRLPLLVLIATSCGPLASPDLLGSGPEPPCGTGGWQRGTLEIHHLDVGQADATLIVSPAGRSLLVDVGEPQPDGEEGARRIGAYVREVLGCARLDYVLVTHFHLDHVGQVGRSGLWHLVHAQGFVVGKTLHRDLGRHVGAAGGPLRGWRDFLAGPDAALVAPEVVREGAGQVHLGPGVTFRVVATDGNGVLPPGDLRAAFAPPSENDYSVAAVLRFGRLDYFIGGDLTGVTRFGDAGYSYHDVEVSVARELGDMDVYRVNHHGSDHASSPTFLAQIDPEVSIISAGEDNPHGHPHLRTLDRLSARGAVYLTSRGARTPAARTKVVGHVVLRSVSGRQFTVAGDPYRASDPVRVDADRDGYFEEADPDDRAPAVGPRPRGTE